MSSKVFLAIPAAVLVVSGCAPVDPGMGEAVAYDRFVQTVNPEPVYAANGAQPGGSGVLGAAASERYRKDGVKAVVRETTQSAGGASGGSSSK